MWYAFVLAIAAVAWAGVTHAADPDARALAAGCASCHQPGARVPPALTGQTRDELVAKLRGFRDGSRTGTVMPQLAKGYTDAELRSLAAYFAAQTRR